jgi:hypothetical protein
MLGYDPSFIHHIHFITEPRMRAWLKRVCGFSVESDFGLGEWLEQMRSPTFSPYTSENIVRAVRLAQRLGLLQLISFLGARLKLQGALRVAVTKPQFADSVNVAGTKR